MLQFAVKYRLHKVLRPLWGMVARWQSWSVLVCAAFFAAPTLIALSQQAWTSEAGSLAPLILVLGLWTLWHAVQRHRDKVSEGSLIIWLAVLAPAIVIMLFASLINMAPLMALATWAVLSATFYALLGWKIVKLCAVPLAFLGLVVPLPFTLSAPANAVLRESISGASVDMARAIGMSAAKGQGQIAIDQYVLAVENACAGASSTLSLVAIGLLFAYWISSAGLGRTLAIAVLAIPIALIANVLRVVGLLWLTSAFGSAILDTAIHPLSGVLSFMIAFILLVCAALVLGVRSLTAEQRS